MNKERVRKAIDIVKRMNENNVSIKEIEEDLRSIGLAPYEVKMILKEAKVQPTPSEIHEMLSKLHTKIDSGEHIKSALKAIDKNKRKLNNIAVKVQELQGDIEEIKNMLEELKKRR